MEAIREQCQRMRVRELQIYLGQNPQYLEACKDIYEQKYKRLYATICTILVMSSADCTIRNLNLNGLDVTISRGDRDMGGDFTRVVDLETSLASFRDFIENPETYDHEDENNALNFGSIQVRIYTPLSWTTDIPNIYAEAEIDFNQYFEAAPHVYALFYGLIKYNDPPTFEEDNEDETSPLIIQRVMEFV